MIYTLLAVSVGLNLFWVIRSMYREDKYNNDVISQMSEEIIRQAVISDLGNGIVATKRRDV